MMFITSSVVMPLSSVSPRFKLFVSAVGACFVICLLVLVFLSIKVGFVHPKLAYAMSCKRPGLREERGRNRAQQIILTEGQAMRSLVCELELLRVEITKRRGPLLIALLEESGGDWDQFEAEYEQENYGHGQASRTM
jgi:hypothetical protein